MSLVFSVYADVYAQNCHHAHSQFPLHRNTSKRKSCDEEVICHHAVGLAPYKHAEGFPSGSAVKNPPAYVGDMRDVGWIPGSGRSPGRGHGYPLQYSCLGNPTDRGAWWATVHGVAKSWTRLKRLSTHMDKDMLEGHWWKNLAEKEECDISPATPGDCPG